ncbi:MAG: hypothetical protein WC244_03400 [Patescibacteria group bacterium]
MADKEKISPKAEINNKQKTVNEFIETKLPKPTPKRTQAKAIQKICDLCHLISPPVNFKL